MSTPRIAALFAAVGIAGAAGGSLLQRASQRAAAFANPFASDRQAARAGAKLYRRECAACHGTGRQGGGSAPPLDRPDVRGAAPGTLFWILRNGDLVHGMPSFAHLPEAQRWQIVTFLQSTTGR